MGIVEVLVFIVAILAVIVILGALFFWAKQHSQAIRAVNRQVEEELGLTNQSPNSKSSFPNLRGTLDGVEVTVDIYHQRYASSKSTASTRPWTRVRAQLSQKPVLQVRKRNQRYSDRIDLHARETGNPAFDQKYGLFMSEDVSLEKALPPTLMDTLIAADPQVDILSKVVIWMQKGSVSDANLLKNAVKSCVRVAAVIENNG